MSEDRPTWPADAGALRLTPITFRSAVPQTMPGQYVLGAVDCAELGLERALLLLDVPNDRLALVAQCGCLVHVPLSTLMAKLAVTLETADHGAQGADGLH